MGYIASNNIRIFPTSNRGAGPAGTNWVTEHNLASIIANLVNNVKDNKGFVVSEGTNGDKTFANTDPVIFYLGGYLVETTWEAITTNTSDSKAKGYCSLINFNVSGKQVTASITIKNSNAAETNALETSYNHLTGNDTGEEDTDEAIPSKTETLSLVITDSSGTVPDSSRINFVHLLLDGGVIGEGEKGSITNKGTIYNNNKITGGNLTHVTIGPEGSDASSFTGNIGASTLTGALNANSQQINSAIYNGTIGTLTSGKITNTAISGTSSFAGTINTSLLDGTLTVDDGDTITPKVTNNLINNTTRIIATRIRGVGNTILKPKDVTGVDTSSNYTTNLALLFTLDDGEL